MTEQVQNGQQTQEDQYLQEALSFYGQAMGRVKSQVHNYRQQLEHYSEQLPDGDAQAQIQEMIDSYSEIEGTMDQAAQDAGVEEAVSQAAEKTQQQMQEVAQGVAQQGQQAAQQATGGEDQQQSDATHAAQQKAQELGVDLSQMQGSGAGGRVTIRDVIGASNQ
jgi:pyruvate/2-oxoglutarate dehydrogenase complex dihydrolipoamide acyltransferase (E2) component